MNFIPILFFLRYNRRVDSAFSLCSSVNASIRFKIHTICEKRDPTAGMRKARKMLLQNLCSNPPLNKLFSYLVDEYTELFSFRVVRTRCFFALLFLAFLQYGQKKYTVSSLLCSAWYVSMFLFISEQNTVWRGNMAVVLQVLPLEYIDLCIIRFQLYGYDYKHVKTNFICCLSISFFSSLIPLYEHGVIELLMYRRLSHQKNLDG